MEDVAYVPLETLPQLHRQWVPRAGGRGQGRLRAGGEARGQEE